MTPKIGQPASAVEPRERFFYLGVDHPGTPQCKGARSATHNPDECTERGKHPVDAWSRTSTNDPAKIRSMRKRGLNLAIDLGKSGLMVLDEDAYGELARFREEPGAELPETYQVKTGKGYHYYFRVPEGEEITNHNPFKRDGYNIDVRGKGGYVVAAGSVHANGTTYEVVAPDAGIAMMPDWLVEYLSAPAPRKVKEGFREAVEAFTGADAHNGGSPYERAAINGIIAQLHALPQPWHLGAGWDQGVFNAACSLFELANTPAFDLTIAEAEAIVRQHAPTDEVWGAEQVDGKIASAHSKIGGKPRQNLPIDVVAESAARKAANETEMRNLIRNYRAAGYTQDAPNDREVERATRFAWSLREQGATPTEASRSFRRISLTDIEFKVTEWAWQDMIPLGILTGLAGWAGIGKSTVTSWAIAKLTRGEFEGDLKGQPVKVLVVAGEDDIERQLGPRLQVAGADMTLVEVFQPTVTVPSGQSIDTVMQIRDDIATIRALLIETGAKVLVLDPILSFVNGNPNNQGDVRQQLDPLAALARELNVAIILVMHFKKGNGIAGEKVSGSHVWRDALRSLLVMAVDQESGYRVVSVDKSNYSDAQGRSMLFEVRSAEVTGRDSQGNQRSQGVSQAVYAGESPMSVDDLLEAESAKRDGRRVVNEDTAEIIGWICEQPEPVSWSEIARQASVDPNAKEGLAKRERTNLMRKLSRAVERGDLGKYGRGLYGKPTGIVPLPGMDNEEKY